MVELSSTGNMQRMESGGEERNGKDAAHARRLEKLRRDFGPVFLGALNDPLTIEILLNADGTLWQEKLGGKMEPIGRMSAARAEAVMRRLHGKQRNQRQERQLLAIRQTSKILKQPFPR